MLFLLTDLCSITGKAQLTLCLLMFPAPRRQVNISAFQDRQQKIAASFEVNAK